jgi:hypothetical protein
MTTKAGRMATMLELVARDAIAALKDVSEEMLNRPVAVPEANSLFAIATHLMGAGEFWTLATVGGRHIERDRDAEFRSTGTYAELATRCDGWVSAVHDLLDEMPDEDLERSTGVKPYRDDIGVDEMTVEHALLRAIDHTAVHLGHIQVTTQLLAGGSI